MTDCPHDRTTTKKRATDKTGWPDEWQDAIIERCLDCGAHYLDVGGRRIIHYDGECRGVGALW